MPRFCRRRVLSAPPCLDANRRHNCRERKTRHDKTRRSLFGFGNLSFGKPSVNCKWDIDIERVLTYAPMIDFVTVFQSI